MTSEQVAVQLKDHEDRILVTEKGVANFQAFRLDTTRKIGFVYGATWFAGIVSAIFIVVLAWALTLIVPAANTVMKEYYRSHPSARVEQRSKETPLINPYSATIHAPSTAYGD